MSYTRRDFLKTGSLGAAAMGLTWNPIYDLNTPVAGMFPDDDAALLKELSAAALEAAKTAGASYADVRFSRTRAIVTRMNKMKVGMPAHANVIQCGVRVLVGGVWGFSAVATRNKDEIVALARGAAKQAKSNTWANKPAVDLAPAPKVENGTWTMPCERDPITVTGAEILADIRAGQEIADKESSWLTDYATRFDVSRDDLVFANSDGTYTTQRLYSVLGGASYSYIQALVADKSDSRIRLGSFIWPRGAGYEEVKKLNFPEKMKGMIEELKMLMKAPPVDVGEYEVVLDGEALGGILGATWGDHTQIDRALGYEANASGTSFVAPPEEVLGKMKVGTQELNVFCNRNTPLSPANIGYDAEGVAPEEFQVIKDGIVVDYQTTREQVAWMKDYYTKANKPMHSHGCADAVGAGNVQLQARPNVVIRPAAKDTSVDQLCSGIEKGVLFKAGMAWCDQQGVTGQAGNLGLTYEIRKGKVGQMVRDAALYFNSVEMFKNLNGLGGASTVVFQGGGTYKGEPYQIGLPSGTSAPAARFKKGKVTNTGRKA